MPPLPAVCLSGSPDGGFSGSSGTPAQRSMTLPCATGNLDCADCAAWAEWTDCADCADYAACMARGCRLSRIDSGACNHHLHQHPPSPSFIVSFEVTPPSLNPKSPSYQAGPPVPTQPSAASTAVHLPPPRSIPILHSPSPPFPLLVFFSLPIPTLYYIFLLSRLFPSSPLHASALSKTFFLLELATSLITIYRCSRLPPISPRLRHPFRASKPTSSSL